MAHRLSDIAIQRALIDAGDLRRPYGMRLLPSPEDVHAPLEREETSDGGNELAPSAVFAVTTEHSALQASRSATIFETGVRLALFLGAVSGGLLALAFVAQVSGETSVFNLFALIVLPVLLVLGALTYLRLVELAIEDVHDARAINRLRRYYFDLSPDTRQYFLLSANDDLRGVAANTGRRHTRWHFLSHAATTILIVTSVLAGASGALATQVVAESWLGLSAGVGLSAALGFGAALARHQTRTWAATHAATETLFPSRAEGGSG